MTAPVSVIIPAYNAAPYLSEAIGSVLSQTRPPLEVLVIDDGSTDGTARIAAAFGDRIRYFRRENRGAAAARNLGLENARGEFIAFLDADDVWLPEKLEVQMRLFERNPALDFVYSYCYEIEAGGAVTGLSPISALPGKPDPARELFIRDTLPNITIVARRRCFEIAGIFDESIVLNEDEEMKIRLLDKCRAGYAPNPLAARRKHGGNKSLAAERILEAFEHDTGIICRKLPRLKRWRKKRESVMRENRGFLYLRADRPLKAFREFTRAAGLDPFRIRPYLLAGLALGGGTAANLILGLKKRRDLPPETPKIITGGPAGGFAGFSSKPADKPR